MEKTVTIANAHSRDKPTRYIEFKMSGGSPWYASIWIDDVLFTIYKNWITGKISIERTQ